MSKKSKRSRKKNNALGYFSYFGRLIISLFPPFLVLVAGLGIFFGLRKALYADTFFEVKYLTVQPPLSLPVAERTALENKFIGRHILEINLHDLSQILEKNPEIKNVAVERHFPSTLALNIEKRIPAALIKFSARGKYGVVAEDGMILRVMSELAPAFVLIEAMFIDSADLRVGQRLHHKGFRECMEFLRVYSESSLAQKYPVQKLLFDAQGNVNLILQNSPEIKLGRHPASRISALHKVTHLLEDKESAKISYIDLQYENVIVKKKG
ncbi:MAG: FtsQ-type POTRA domain-containing protein [Candidatus Omnitrophica bacterium]|nr:FtsQ-type POTRA domain-containing protein [Candidatus Omnitrophota bacterium]